MPMDREMCIAFEHPEGWLVRKKFDIVFGHRQRRIPIFLCMPDVEIVVSDVAKLNAPVL